MENNSHSIEQLQYGDFVLVLNTEAKIDPQAQAMIQALHSRSTGGIKHHLKILEEKGAENFMERFYVGYGHKSIGDCASTTVFVEGISMLAAKAIQDWRLYSGQEASTRYVDFSKQTFLDPLNSVETSEILEAWRSFYLKILPLLQIDLEKKHPIQDGEKKGIYDKAILARAFDIARAFLPAGATTNVAWTMNFRQFADEIMLLRHHPLPEIVDIANSTEKALKKLYPQSFCHKQYEETEKYNEEIMKQYYYTNSEAKDFEMMFNGIDKNTLKKYISIINSRPTKTELPPFVADCGVMSYEFLLDFGSFRDLQRHRAIVQRMPLLNREHGFYDWYMQNLPVDIKEEAKELIAKQEKKINELDTSEEIKQYYTAMGYRVPCKISGDIKALTYLAELRCTRFVHPTLVEQIIKLIDNLEKELAEFEIKIYRDNEPNRFDIKRGQHDIVEKGL